MAEAENRVAALMPLNLTGNIKQTITKRISWRANFVRKTEIVFLQFGGRDSVITF